MPELLVSLQAQQLSIPYRTLRRYLASWVKQGRLNRSRQKRGTRYQIAPQEPGDFPGFLHAVDTPKRPAILNLLRDRWTHSSAALEGNTLSLGDTHAILELGLTISGKPQWEHQEILGHARAIDLLYRMTINQVTMQHILNLHKGVQQEAVMDALAPVGAWKVEPNYISSMTSTGEQVIIEYAAPTHIPRLMDCL